MVKKKVHVSTLATPALVTPEVAERMRSRVVVLGVGEETGEHETSMREELLIPLEGTATLVGPDGVHQVMPGQALFIPKGMIHNVRNQTNSPIRYIYVLALHTDYETIKKHDHH
jgi:mannose-6-phosphate isomerase-like protein (cupin superfamily)